MTQADIEYTVRKFTLPVEQNERIDSLARSHYGGNGSHYLRAAHADHARTLSGEGEVLQDLITDVKRLSDAIDELKEILDANGSGAGGQPAPNQTNHGAVDGEFHDSTPMNDDMYRVHQRLIDAYPAEQLLGEIVDSTDLSETEVRHALVDLNDRGQIAPSRIDCTTRYTVTTDDSE
jgi:hypothetical protein